ncbi:MAG: AMP-binding protein [Deltaproteobacteria bacterium]|nr:AMP-binding protein [Deltaproteobacteria bacterium]
MASNDLIRQRLVHRALRAQAERYGNREFFRFEGASYGFEDFDQASDQVAAGLQAAGIAKGDRVAVIMGNRPEFLFLWFGIAKAGGVEVPVNTAHRGDLLIYMLAQSGSKLLVVEECFLERVAPVLYRLPELQTVVVLGPATAPAQTPALDRPAFSWEELLAGGGSFQEPDLKWSDPFAIIYTSGTTGPSKGSLLPHNYALYMGEICGAAAEYGPLDCLYNALPLFHGNAQFLSTMPALMSGARMVLAPRFSASAFWDDIRAYGCTEFNYIGGILQILFKAEPRPDDADNPLRVMFGAGAPPDLYRPFEERFGVKIIEGYGLSEVGVPLLNTVRERKPGSCGKLLPDYEVRLVDDDGLPVPVGQPGEALLRTSRPFSILLGYHDMPAQTVEAWQDLWFHTGDYLRQDEDGYYHFVDRKKDAIRRRGENISSFEVEKGVRGHGAVLECAAVAVKSPLGEDEVMICLTLRPGQTLTPEELMDHCAREMAYFMVPRYVRIMERLPKTPTERVQKFELRQAGVTPDTWDREKAGYQLKK